MKICNNCQWFATLDKNGDYSHSEAVLKQKGCCLVQDLFTNNEELEVKPDYEACNSFSEDI